jgi:predicted acetyltransferase
MRLVEASMEASMEWKDAFLDYARESDDPRYAAAFGDVGEYLKRIQRQSRAECLPPGWVPGTQFWLEDGGRIVAVARLRFWLNAELEHEGGHIGYDVRPSLRRHGHGTRVLALTLAEARRRGIARVLLTTDDDNVGSIKIIERNGGRLAGAVLSRITGKKLRQYWIELAEAAS